MEYWEDGYLVKCLPSEHEDLVLDSQNPHIRLAIETQAHNPGSTRWEADTGGFWKLAWPT